MRHLAYTDNKDDIEVVLLIKERNLDQIQIERHYLNPLKEKGHDLKKFLIVTLAYNDANKVPVKFGRTYLDQLAILLAKCKNLHTVWCADGPYFKLITGAKQVNASLGYVKQGTHPGFERYSVIVNINYAALFHNDGAFETMDRSREALLSHLGNSYVDPGTGIIQKKIIPNSMGELESLLNELHRHPRITCDIEGFSLRFYQAKIATITFCWNIHEGMVLDLDFTAINSKAKKDLLRQFFKTYKGEIYFHGGVYYDVKVLIYELFMSDSTDMQGMLNGLDVFKSMHDTMHILYLCKNSTADVSLGLKENAQEFTGDYAQEEIHDITLIPREDLLEYNLVDGLATMYVRDKYYPIMQSEDQEDYYVNFAQPSMINLVKMMMVGLPMNMDNVQTARVELEKIRSAALRGIANHPLVLKAEFMIQVRTKEKDNAKLKRKVKTLADYRNLKFNPGSGKQLQVLFYEVMQLPVIDLTKKKAPATGQETIEKLINHIPEDHQDEIELMQHLISLSQVDILLNNFIKNFEQLAFHRKGKGEFHNTYWLNGDLKSTTVPSGRLASSKPNMQNIPSTGNIYAKLIKKCFEAPKGWLLGGIDFSSLEDRINAILTKDPNKIKVYTDGFDGHCLRAYAYFKDKMPDITDANDVGQINSIADKYPKLRQDSKSPTFALTYLGTWHTLVKNLGISKLAAIAIESNYHDLYKVSDEFSEREIRKASEKGFAIVAFGLKLRTPILGKTIYGSSKTPYEAQKEGRSLNNAITQSWGQLTVRAINEFEERLAKSPYRLDIFIANTIHDANYFVYRNRADVVKWLNDNIVECMRWNEDPLIKSKEVPMEATFEIYYPTWAESTEVPNNASEAEIQQILDKL